MQQQILKRIDSKLSSLLNKPKKEPETWVKSTIIIEKTGWSYERMRAARKHGYVSYKKDENGIRAVGPSNCGCLCQSL